MLESLNIDIQNRVQFGNIKNNQSSLLMYFTQKQIEKNPNSQHSILPQLQLTLANGNAQFMILLARQMKISYTIPSLALHISQIFFQKKCYLYYDRFIILTAAFALASKIKDMQCRLKSICNSYYNVISRNTMNFEPFNEEKMKIIKDQICIAETQILRTLEYKADFVTPHDYLKRHVQNLGQSKDSIKKVFNYSRIIIMDSYRARCCLMFNPLVICVSALMIAARYEGFRPYLSDVNKQILLAKKKELNKIAVSGEQGQIVVQSDNNKVQIKTAKLDEEQKKLDDKQKQKLKHDELYECWINTISEREGEELKQQDILECIKLMNDILKNGLHNS